MYTRGAKVSLLIVLLLDIMLLAAAYNVQKDSDDTIIVQTIKGSQPYMVKRILR